MCVYHAIVAKIWLEGVLYDKETKKKYFGKKSGTLKWYPPALVGFRIFWNMIGSVFFQRVLFRIFYDFFWFYKSYKITENFK